MRKIDKDAGGRLRVSQLTTLFDGKTLNGDESDLWHTAAGSTGTATFDTVNNAMQLSVTAGQWIVRQQNWYCPYYSGKSQFAESTTIDFAPQAGVIKRVGYFSSSATAPYTANLDGYWLESNGDISTSPATAIRLVISRDGTQTAIPLQNWNNYNELQNYNWNNFTVCPSDFLWLGGNDLRFFTSLPIGGFSSHTVEHAGNNPNIIFKSPNQPLRYELRSGTGNGSGSFKFVCGQVSTEGSNFESSRSRAFFNTTALNVNTAGTTYALLGIKKQVAFRNNVIKITNFGAVNSGTSDSGILMLLKDPTLSAPLTYANDDKVQIARATNQTVTAFGTIIAAMPVGTEGQHEEMNENFMLYLQNKIDDSLSEYVLAYLTITATQAQTGILTYKIL